MQIILKGDSYGDNKCSTVLDQINSLYVNTIVRSPEIAYILDGKPATAWIIQEVYIIYLIGR